MPVLADSHGNSFGVSLYHFKQLYEIVPRHILFFNFFHQTLNFEKKHGISRIIKCL